jgi:hypothetical protein
MTDADKKADATSGAKPAGKIRQTIETPVWIRVMRFVIAAVSAYMLYHVAMRFRDGHLSATDSWLIGLFGTLGLSALVEAIWPEGNHGLLQFWCLTALAASGLASWAAGGDTWIGGFATVMMAASFLLAAMSSAKGRRS